MKFRAARSIAVSLALCAMMLRALLPDGWMPAANAADGVPFVICSIDGHHSNDGKAPGGQRTHAPCAFAAAAPLSPPTAATTLLPAFDAATWLAQTSALPPPVAAAEFRPNAARAPPSHV